MLLMMSRCEKCGDVGAWIRRSKIVDGGTQEANDSYV